MAAAAVSALAFVLNLDAELELERGARYAPAALVLERVARMAREIRPTLPAGSVVIEPLAESAPSGACGIAWSPTPRALRAFDRASVARPAAPDVDVLARVNARPFAHALSEGELPGAVLARDLDVAVAALARPGEWLLKRSFGVSGRGQRRVRGGHATDADRAFVAASLRRDGALVIEPRVAIARELSVHAWVTRSGTSVRSIREQTVSLQGAFVRSSRALGLDPPLERRLVDTAERAGAALAEAGYHGPFGADAYLHRGAGEAPLALRSLSEINARYCMGWDDRDGWRTPG